MKAEPYDGAYRVMEQSFKEAQQQLELTIENLLTWAVRRWNEEVKDRPLDNVHRRALDDTWRQVIRYAGGDDIQLCGPTHDKLQRSNAKKPATKKPTHPTVQKGICQSCYFYVNCARRCLVHKRYVEPDYTCSYHTNLTELAQT